MKAQKVICIGCGEIYDVADSSFKECPLEVCGECGGDFFVKQSRKIDKGFLSQDQYWGVQELIPERLRPSLDSFIEQVRYIYHPETK